jgi:HSP20 family protein
MPSHFHVRPAAAHPLLREFDNLVRDLAAPSWGYAEPRTSFVPPADAWETQEGLTLQVDLPGHDPEGIQVTVEKDTLTLRSERKAAPRAGGEGAEQGLLRAERRFGTFERAFVLPPTVDASRVEARYEAGVLTLTLPKREEARPRTVQVKVQGQ